MGNVRQHLNGGNNMFQFQDVTFYVNKNLFEKTYPNNKIFNLPTTTAFKLYVHLTHDRIKSLKQLNHEFNLNCNKDDLNSIKPWLLSMVELMKQASKNEEIFTRRYRNHPLFLNELKLDDEYAYRVYKILAENNTDDIKCKSITDLLKTKINERNLNVLKEWQRKINNPSEPRQKEIDVNINLFKKIYHSNKIFNLTADIAFDLYKWFAYDRITSPKMVNDKFAENIRMSINQFKEIHSKKILAFPKNISHLTANIAFKLYEKFTHPSHKEAPDSTLSFIVGGTSSRKKAIANLKTIINELKTDFPNLRLKVTLDNYHAITNWAQKIETLKVTNPNFHMVTDSNFRKITDWVLKMRKLMKKASINIQKLKENNPALSLPKDHFSEFFQRLNYGNLKEKQKETLKYIESQKMKI